jgi:3-phenylpropionate/trans-cinnamate dioxygenase ferredoxin subunit
MYNYSVLDEKKCEFVQIAAENEVGDGERLFVEIDKQPIVVFRVAGKLFAIGDVCSHDDGPLGDGEIEGDEIICPRHGARFDIHTGKVRSLPAVMDIPAYPVRVRNGQIEIGIPSQS